MLRIKCKKTKLSAILTRELNQNKQRTIKSDPIEALVIQARAFPFGSQERDYYCRRILNENLGLCKTIAGKTGARLEYGDVMGYMWMAIVKAVEEWQPDRAKPSTMIVAKAMAIISDDAYWGHMNGCVRTPKRSKIYRGLSVSDVPDFELHLMMQAIQ
jgi:hypothetical protein